MASLLERLKYIIEDIFGKKTYAESQRDKYKNVVRNLEKEWVNHFSRGIVDDKV